MAASAGSMESGGPSTGGEPDEIRVGHAFVDAVVGGDFDRIEALLAPDVRFRALVPRETREASAAAGARAIIEDWFGETDNRELLESKVELLVGRLVATFRLQLREAGTWFVVQQELVATVADGRVHDLAMLCTGFRPLPAAPSGVRSRTGAARDSSGGAAQRGSPLATWPRADGRLDGIGLSCATLTPTIRSAVNGLEPGQVLEIVTDDPTAGDGLRSWTRLTGHELVATVAGGDAANRFYVRRASPPIAKNARGGTDR